MEQRFEYIHKVCYYETDMMGVVHHSNYVRWMEEARCSYLESKGFSFKRLQDTGIFSPTISIQCKYIHPCRFEDEIKILIKETSYTKVRVAFEYEFYLGDKLICSSSSMHCLTDKDGLILRGDKACPELDNLFMANLEKEYI